ncbi:MAG: hypothetical protein LBU51_05350 [Bacteroidales bacterium]|jgi:hypothetical protein|nr:hypothetical protein [Bacteroidales bacterium]
MKKVILLSGFLLLALFSMNAQEAPEQSENSDFDYGVALDFQIRYVWRGQLLGGSAPCIQPGTYINWKGLEFGVWGSYSLSTNPYAELDLYLSYTFWKDMFTVIFTDYGFPIEFASDFNFFDYKHNHVLEAGISYNGIEKVPVSLEFYINVFGADAVKQNEKNVYSMYSELAYSPTWKKLGVDFRVFVGCALNGPNYKYWGVDPTDMFTPMEFDAIGFYGNHKFAVVNTGITATKSFKIHKKLTLPLSVGLIYNPAAKKAYFNASVGIAL